MATIVRFPIGKLNGKRVVKALYADGQESVIAVLGRVSEQRALTIRDTIRTAYALGNVHGAQARKPARLVALAAPTVATPSQAKREAARLLALAKPENTFRTKVLAARVGCAYDAPECREQRFAPNGRGSRQHTTCSRGRDALAAARGK